MYASLLMSHFSATVLSLGCTWAQRFLFKSANISPAVHGKTVFNHLDHENTHHFENGSKGQNFIWIYTITWSKTLPSIDSHQSIKDVTHTFDKLQMEKYVPLNYRLIFCGNFHINYAAICIEYDLNKCPIVIKSPVLLKSSPLLDRFISYALHFPCQVFIKLKPILRAAQAVSGPKWYRSNTRSSKLLKPHRNNS